MTNAKVIIEADAELRDEAAYEWLSILQTKIDTINERTKKHTREIKELQKR